MFSFPTIRRQFAVKSFTASSVVSMALNSHNGVKEAVVRIRQDEANLTITLSIVGKSRILNRPKTEPLGRSLERLRLSLAKPKTKGKKQTNHSEANNSSASPSVVLFPSELKSNPVSESLKNEEAWLLGRYLVAGDHEYKVVVNPPTVEKLEMKDRVMIGHPVCPLCTLAFAELGSCKWSWFRQQTQSGEIIPLDVDQRIYTPSVEDLGCYLQVQCTPFAGVRNGAPQILKIGPVEKGPGKSSGDGRHGHTSQLTESPVVRIVSYNVLAGAYTSRPNAVSIIFKYCDPKYLDVDYRKQLVLNEVLRYNADILCLQEVDTRVYESYLKLHLENNGFHSIFTQKSKSTREGSAVFIRQSRFKVVEHRALVLNHVLDMKLPTYLSPFRAMINESDMMRTALKAVGTVAQITLIEPLNSSERMLCVVNTHLIANNHAEHIRLLHVVWMLNVAKEVIAAHGNEAQLIFTGDLNSSPGNGVLDATVQFLTDGFISPEHWEWKECSKFVWKTTSDDEDSAVEEEKSEVAVELDPIQGIHLSAPFEVKSAMSLDTPWTNYTDLFKGLLDYIWYEPKYLQLERIIPLPAEEQLEGPIPSAVYPSDHLAIIAELRFKEREDEERVKLANKENLRLGVRALENGEIIGVPTDTIYGLAGKAGNPEAIHRIYEVKKRALQTPLPVCVADPEDIPALCKTDHLPKGLLQCLLPGSVTVVLTRKESDLLSAELNPGLETVGVRVADCQFLRELCKELKAPIALTSANSSGETSSTAISNFRHLWSQCAWVFDAGEVSSSHLGSTIIDLSIPQTFRIIRKGDGLEKVQEVMKQFGFLEQER